MEKDLDTFAKCLASHPDGFGRLFGRMGYVLLLPLLELPYAEVSERLLASFVAAGLSKDQVTAISLKELIKFAVERGSGYWIDLAVGWLNAGFPLDHELVESIDNRIAGEPKLPQKLRHEAFRLVRQWERNHNEE